MFSISLETLLSTHFMYGDPDYNQRCVASSRTALLLGDVSNDDYRKHKKYSGYVVYVAYRLETASLISHSQKLSKVANANAAAGNIQVVYPDRLFRVFIIYLKFTNRISCLQCRRPDGYFTILEPQNPSSYRLNF